LEFKNITFKNDRDSVIFSENLEISGLRLASKAGNRLILPLNFLRVNTLNLPRNESRKLPLIIERGQTYKDTFQFKLPAGFKVESIPEEVVIENDFGKLKVKTSLTEKAQINVERLVVLKEGSWKSSEYEAYREFMNQIRAYTNQKAVLVSN